MTSADQTAPPTPGDVAQGVERSEGTKKAEEEAIDPKKQPADEPKKDKTESKPELSGSSEGTPSSQDEAPAIIPAGQKELLKEPVKKDTAAPETSPTSPSDLAKLESTVLSILEAQANTTEKEDPHTIHDQKKDRRRPKTLPISPESLSSEEGELEDAGKGGESILKDAPADTGPRKERKKLHVLPDTNQGKRQRYDSVEDSSESEPSPLLQRRRKISAASTSSEEDKQESLGSGDEEDFIRKQIMEMSADEDASEDEENYVRKHIREEEQKREQEDKKGKVKSTSGKSKRLLKKSSASHETEPGRRHSWQESEEREEESTDSKKRETKSQEGEESSTDNGGGLRRFKTIELNNTTASPYSGGATVRQSTEEGELEMESLTDSPEDRSRGEGSSSLHASSFTPGTSPTSVSSLDEDSDSSPSHKRMSGEGKQHRKARHRQHGQVLPTIEDSSEEEEMREEEELLREQEMQREVDQQQVKKSSSKKSKKDKEELRAQRRREHPKTPPSNLSPIEDASPTEELRQAAEMEELHKSSCSEYSPSIESEPEGFEIHPDKILAVQKVYQLPTSVSLYSPTEDRNAEITKDEQEKSLKSADEAYEEMMQKAKTLQNKKGIDAPPEKEPLYGGMLIEDYIYESLVENTVPENCVAQKQEPSKISVQEPVKKLRSPDEVYEDMQKKREILLKDQKVQQQPPIKKTPLPDPEMSLPAITSIPSYANVSTNDTAPQNKDGKPLLDAEAAYEELMKRQRVILTPGTSPTQPLPEFRDSPEVILSEVGAGILKGNLFIVSHLTGLFLQTPLPIKHSIPYLT
ncbi:hypothetical protein AGOR_G00182160 [Albula goreensis]|uniref:Uncharacterized protein n=1 Tax=Albula goreensis TaxID=1534307 RepID=A0A8T3CS84_9TELE|nr:hypothetical protein AGOR_G00182160 [Albula goreensis]